MLLNLAVWHCPVASDLPVLSASQAPPYNGIHVGQCVPLVHIWSYSFSTSWYLAMACSARMRRAVSVATPTMMSTLVPAKPRNAVRCVMPSTSAGAADSAPRNNEPRMDMRVRVAVTYSAVCRPGRTAGIAAPPRLSCSDRSFGSSCRNV
eukprot:363670-Chlamydomonas_euryale.AAC.25